MTASRCVAPTTLCLPAGQLLVHDLDKGFADWRHLGVIYYARAHGSKIVRSQFPLITPNGIGCRRTSTRCMSTRRLPAIGVPGVVAPPTGTIPGWLITTLANYQLINSMAVWADGKVCAATPHRGAITMIDRVDGKTDYIDVPDGIFITNICFGAADMRDVYIMVSGRGKFLKATWRGCA